jgi:YggT family protein
MVVGKYVELVLYVLDKFLWIMMFAIIARAIVSWFDPTGSNPISRFLFEFTEPIIAPIRTIVPRTGMIDLSPMIAIFIIIILQQVLGSVATA